MQSLAQKIILSLTEPNAYRVSPLLPYSPLTLVNAPAALMVPCLAQTYTHVCSANRDKQILIPQIWF